MKLIFWVFRKSYHWFLDAVFPARCVLCFREGFFLCSDHIHFPPAPHNEAVFESLDAIFARTAYGNKNIQRIVDFYKFRGFHGLAPFLSRSMMEILSPELLAEVTLVPIPLHWTRKLWRGFNQSELLAREITKLCPQAKILQGLRRIKKTRQQAALPRQERLVNIKNAFAWNSKIPLPEKILLVDDVVASGSTLDEAAKVLKSAGAVWVGAVVFARGGKN